MRIGVVQLNRIGYGPYDAVVGLVCQTPFEG